ncbi:hypothetical protein MCA2956 [Methylococcus capsulatus str. Bath]|uniref:Uncharacterized protein n=1 Tax=Methylococcus capsulatus (strain ATCC 33009 / NCIMB 11132 / Bath) TaxID=243233 RepID=Q602V3_METCA|nr:hypothetical protein MCA2956 [Methylococcus capsulatus str. Bath]
MMSLLEVTHARAFSVAAAMKESHLLELKSRIDLLVATGASFREAETTLRPLCAAIQKDREESV